MSPVKANLEIRKCNLQCKPRKSCSGSNIDHGFILCHIVSFAERNTIHKMFLHDFIIFCNCSKVHYLIPLHQHLKIFQKLPDLFIT